MNYDFLFSKWMYLKNSWYKYVISWIVISIVLSALMYFNGKLSIASASVTVIFVLLYTILIMFNRLRTWKKSEVKLRENSIKYICVKEDGYEANIESGRRKKVVTYFASPIKKVKLSGKCIRIYGDVIVSEKTYANSMVRNKEKQICEFDIPPYFTDWQTILKLLSKLNGGSEHER